MSDHSELKRLAEAATPGPWAYDGSYVCPARTEDGTTYVELWRSIADCHQPENTKFIAAANPAAVLALIAEIDQLKSDSLCPACEGSGEGWVRSDNGPDAHNIQVDCSECFGPGTMLGAYQAMKIQRDSQIERTVKAGGDLLFMRSERDQLKAEVEALRKDAERYRWLRDKSEALHSFYLSVPIWMTGVKFNKDTVDSTIDTIRAGAEQ